MRAMVRWCPPFLAAGVLIFALASGFRAEEADAAMDNKALDKKIRAVVKTVINRGADMFNVYRDYAGCYRYYQGSLTTLETMLDHHPKLQKAIRDGLAEAERTASVPQRAFVLRRALGTVWEHFNPRAKPVIDRRPEDKPPADKPRVDGKPVDKPKDKPTVDKRPADKPNKDVPKDLSKDVKPVDKPVTDKPAKDNKPADKDKPADKPATDKKPNDKEKANAKVSGKVTYQGKPLPGGEVIFFPAEKANAYAAKIQADGTYSLPAIATGQYRIAVDTSALKPRKVKDASKDSKKPPKDSDARKDGEEAAKKFVAIPAKYSDPKTSGLTLEMTAGSNTFDVALK